MTRGLFLIIGLGAAALAGYVLLTGVDLAALLGQSSSVQSQPTPPSHDEIDDESRQRLRAILREADKNVSD